jgi:hypothetical protein
MVRKSTSVSHRGIGAHLPAGPHAPITTRREASATSTPGALPEAAGWIRSTSGDVWRTAAVGCSAVPTGGGGDVLRRRRLAAVMRGRGLL